MDNKANVKHYNLSELIFRHKDGFYAGSWNAFKQHWLPFVQEYKDSELKDELYDTLHYGVDTLSFSKHYPLDNPAKFRSPVPNICSLPRYDTKYHQARVGTNPNKHLTVKRLYIRKHYHQSQKYYYDQPKSIANRTVIGYRPILESHLQKGHNIGKY